MQNRNKKSFGSKGEQIAAEYLLNSGCRLLRRNYRVGRLGEVDIIALDRDYICFIEVKTRSSTAFGTPAEAVGKNKQNNILKLANIYLSQTNSFDQNIRFDVIEILFDTNNSKHPEYTLNHIKNAF